MIKLLLRRIRAYHAVKYKPLIQVHVSKKALLYNLSQFQNITTNQVAPVLKANAYGHGLVEVAKCLDDQDVPFIVVDTYYEALVLRNEKVQKPILIIGYTVIDNMINSTLPNVSFTITSKDQLEHLAKAVVKPIAIHLKFDTGMRRQGIEIDKNVPRGTFDDILSIISQNKNIIVKGVCSHFSDADNKDSTITPKQIALWNQVVDYFTDKLEVKYFHISATTGMMFEYSKNVPRGTFNKIKSNVSRLGIGLYGISITDYKEIDLRPVLSMSSIITSIRTVYSNEAIGYNGTFKANKTIKVATVPVGYAEGLDRRLSNIGTLRVISKENVPRGTFCKILGRISMNITTIDVSDVMNIAIGDEVQIISNDTKDNNSVQNMAALCNTIPYELLIHIPSNLRRICE